MAYKGHTGVEGQSTKRGGIFLLLVGVIWSALAFLLDGGLLLPVLIGVVGLLTFLVGRSMAKAHNGTGGF